MHGLSDVFGRDIRDRLKHQARLHQRVAPLGIAPSCNSYFEIDQDGYLPISFQKNDNFERIIQELTCGTPIDHCDEFIFNKIYYLLGEIGVLLERLHSAGIVHRDLSPSNVLIGEAGGPLLSDLEIAWEIGSDEPPFGKGTPGFMGPEQLAGSVPHPANDVHAYAALILYAITGTDPRRLPVWAPTANWRSLRDLVRSIDARLWSALQSSLSPAPADRPRVVEVRDALLLAHRVSPRRRRDPGTAGVDLEELLHGGVASLTSPALGDSSGIWLSAPVAGGARGESYPEIRRSLNRGVAGPLYFCARYARKHHLTEDVSEACKRNAAWLIEYRDAPDHGMPGLHFGELGVLLALYEARQSHIIDFRHDDVAQLWSAALEHPLNWPDFTHGSAGVAVGLDRLAQLTASDPDPTPFDLEHERTRRYEHIVEIQNPDGSWRLPEGVEGLSGDTVTGFAHGVAGMAYALAQSGGLHPDHARYQDAAVRAAEWLLSVAEHGPNRSLVWPYSNAHRTRWNWWCHGGPGIAALFCCLFTATGASRYRDAALACFTWVPHGFNPANLSTCHGAAGLGELMLDVGRAVQESNLVSSATNIAHTIAARHARGTRDYYWVVENPDFVSADLMVGLCGVLHFLLRVVSQDKTFAFPTLI